MSVCCSVSASVDAADAVAAACSVGSSLLPSSFGAVAFTEGIGLRIPDSRPRSCSSACSLVSLSAIRSRETPLSTANRIAAPSLVRWSFPVSPSLRCAASCSPSVACATLRRCSSPVRHSALSRSSSPTDHLPTLFCTIEMKPSLSFAWMHLTASSKSTPEAPRAAAFASVELPCWMASRSSASTSRAWRWKYLNVFAPRLSIAERSSVTRPRTSDVRLASMAAFSAATSSFACLLMFVTTSSSRRFASSSAFFLAPAVATRRISARCARARSSSAFKFSSCCRSFMRLRIFVMSALTRPTRTVARITSARNPRKRSACLTLTSALFTMASSSSIVDFSGSYDAIKNADTAVLAFSRSERLPSSSSAICMSFESSLGHGFGAFFFANTRDSSRRRTEPLSRAV
eukprot:PhM_4_TR1309/c0_g1_i1/m.105530